MVWMNQYLFSMIFSPKIKKKKADYGTLIPKDYFRFFPWFISLSLIFKVFKISFAFKSRLLSAPQFGIKQEIDAAGNAIGGAFRGIETVVRRTDPAQRCLETGQCTQEDLERLPGLVANEAIDYLDSIHGGKCISSMQCHEYLSKCSGKKIVQKLCLILQNSKICWQSMKGEHHLLDVHLSCLF